MKIHLPLFLIVFAIAQTMSAATLTNESIIKMVNAGLDNDTILLAINQGDNDFNTSADGLIELKENKVPEDVIQAMLKGGTGKQNPAPKNATSARNSGSNPSKPVYITLPPTISPEMGYTYFLRYSLHYERSTYNTTNYERGMLLPVNTQVTLLSLSPKAMTFQVESTGEVIKVKNNSSYTGKDMNGMAELMFSDTPTNIEAFPDRVSTAIRTGEIYLGMTKQQVLLARGYPPAHKTPSVDSDRWTYWSSRFVIQTIVFSNDILVEGRGL